jgi:hypothetical protein
LRLLPVFLQIDTLKRLNELDFETLVPGHGGVLKGRTFVQLEIELLSAVLEAMTREIARTSAEPPSRYDEIKKAVEQHVDKTAWARKFAGEDQDERDFFVDFCGLVCCRRCMLSCGLTRARLVGPS